MKSGSATHVKPTGIRQARKLAWANAGAHIRNMDLESLYGDFPECDEEVMARAQQEIADACERKAK